MRIENSSVAAHQKFLLSQLQQEKNKTKQEFESNEQSDAKNLFQFHHFDDANLNKKTTPNIQSTHLLNVHKK